MLRQPVSILALCALLVPTVAAAADVEVAARATTLLGGRPDVRDGQVYTVVPFIELVSLSARGLGGKTFDDLKIVVAAWGSLDPGEPIDDDRADGDVDLGYIEAGLGKGALTLRAGRQLVFTGGLRATGLDGGFAEGRLGPVGLSVYGGVPVTPRFGLDRGDSMWGARAFVRRSIDAELGISYIHAMDDGRVARFDLGADGRYALSRRLIVTALGLFSVEAERLAEARLAVNFEPARRVHVTVEGARTAPDLFLSRASVLSVFAESERNEVGATITARPLRDLNLRLAYFALDNADGLGHRAEIRGDVAVGRRAVVGCEAGLLTLEGDAGYQHGRIFGRTAIAPRMWLSLDGDLYHLDEELNGTDLSVRGSATLRWDPAPRWRAVITALAGSDPFAERRFEAMAKLAWSFAP